MDTTSKNSAKQFENFEPEFQWIDDAQNKILAVNVFGFKKEEVRVQIENFVNLKISGERALGNNKWSRFRMNFPLPENCKYDQIKAKLDEGSLFVVMPKIDTDIIEEEHHEPAKGFPATEKSQAEENTIGSPEKKKGVSDGVTREMTHEIQEKKEKNGDLVEKESEKSNESSDAGKLAHGVTEKQLEKENSVSGARIWPETQKWDSSWNALLNVVVAFLVLVLALYVTSWSKSSNSKVGK